RNEPSRTPRTPGSESDNEPPPTDHARRKKQDTRRKMSHRSANIQDPAPNPHAPSPEPQPLRLTEAQVWSALDMVMDPEIPMVSVVELGIIQRVAVEDGGGRVVVTLTPTFTGCPALTAMREEIAARVGELGVDEVAVPISFDPPWTSDRISESA